MAITQQPQRGGALATMEPNLYRPMTRQASSTTGGLKPSAFTKASPLKKQSDYAVVAPLQPIKPLRQAPPPPTSRPVAGAAKVPSTPPKAAANAKPRKKFLCETPPAVLQNTRKKTEYDRGRQLGEGGFARCFMVQNKDGIFYAAKTVSRKSLKSDKMRQKFIGEIQVHKTMQHPNVVRFVECFEDEDNVYMILELCPNKSLMDMLRRRRRFTEPEVRFFMLQLLGALKYMHGKKVIHRDLKLGNIFLDTNMNIKLGDFGLAALLVTEDERKKTICGTPNYIAPEVLFDSGKEGEGHSYEVDIWGVGVIMYAMLVGKPPFQSTDVDSIYKKIRQNTFEWPENITISLTAKSLVNSILNRDPDARPSLDEIASHNFFRSGLFPKTIPVSAQKEEPIWPSIGQKGLAAVSAARVEWKKNYDEVAKTSGVGIDSMGNPVRPVGGEAGKPLSIDPVPGVRPVSSSSASTTDNNCVDVQKILEQKRREKEFREAAEKEKYILPETLSPRDGHARMRNIHALKRVPSRLGGQRGLFNREAPVKEESEEEQSSSPEPEPVKPFRQLDQKPIRRSSNENAPAPVNVPQPKTTSALPRRAGLRSYAAHQREPVNVPKSIPVNKPESAPAPKVEKIDEPQARVTTVRTAPARPTSTATTLTSQTSSNSGKSTRTSPSQIPHAANYSSRIGRPIANTTTTAILKSFLPIINNLTAFCCSSTHRLSPPPAATAEAIGSHQKGEKNTAVFVSKWVDYTNKYGMAYILSDGTSGMLYNDNTSLVVNSVNGDHVEWITNSLITEGEQSSKGTQEAVMRRLATEMSVIKEKGKTSKGLGSKQLIWRRTSNYMMTSLGANESWEIGEGSAIREPSMNTNVSDDEHMIWLTHYARLRRCVVFRMVDGGLQFNFMDHTKVILTSTGRTIRLIDKEHNLHVISLEEADKRCSDGDAWLTLFGLRQKMSYIKEILKAWSRKGRFPRDIDLKEGETPETCIVLGEGPAL